MSKAGEIIDSILNLTKTTGANDASCSDSTQPSPTARESSASANDEMATAALSAASDIANFPEAISYPTQKTDSGVAFDFNHGARVSVPEGRWRVTITDTERSVCLYDSDASYSLVICSKKYFIPTRIEVRSLDTDEVIVSHDFDCRDRDVAILLPGSTLGDAIGWFSYAVKFQQKHQCRLTVAMNAETCKLFNEQYPNINFCTLSEYQSIKHLSYATYYIGLFFHDECHDWQPSDFRLVGLHRAAAHILGVNPEENRPRLNPWPVFERPIEGPYVVIATQASSQCKYWNNPIGWSGVIRHLKSSGYEVVCIDKSPISGHHNHWNYIPHGTRDETGDRPLTERAYWLRHAAFFIGLSSGLSWLAWAVGTPTILISGFTHPLNEFETPYRVFNPHVCNSCWHDIRTPFEHGNFLFCPRHKNTPRQFECSGLISPEHVISCCNELHKEIFPDQMI